MIGNHKHKTMDVKQVEEVDFSDFEILEKGTWASIGRFAFPAISIGGKDGSEHAYFNKAAVTLIRGEGSEAAGFARRGGIVYVSFLPKLTTIQGYSLRSIYKDGVAAAQTITAERLVRLFGITRGAYRILIEDSIFIKDITWYPLEKIEEEELE